MTQAQQNKLLAIRPVPKPVDTSQGLTRLMYMDDDNSSAEYDDNADDEEEIITKIKPKSKSFQFKIKEASFYRNKAFKHNSKDIPPLGYGGGIFLTGTGDYDVESEQIDLN
ncbi:MAG: hypothetical protein EZS28_039506 [Streblomastix strix]|uniref:Uncharacterized protein n=1 Tax=Streblomastix strix TaxID=222440 RepID=A0A5J4U304_9EUKA|nr:MAG: hypothetical protein EZS28_039506 [Streblomastix strix]